MHDTRFSAARAAGQFRGLAVGGLLAAGMLLPAGGCGRSDGRLAVKGAVTLDGEPVDGGVVSFLPESAGEGSTVAGAYVARGRYELGAAKGLVPGSYRVEIRIPRPTGRMMKDRSTGEPTPETQEAAPARYNELSELRATVGPGMGDLDFRLDSAGAPVAEPERR